MEVTLTPEEIYQAGAEKDTGWNSRGVTGDHLSRLVSMHETTNPSCDHFSVEVYLLSHWEAASASVKSVAGHNRVFTVKLHVLHFLI